MKRIIRCICLLLICVIMTGSLTSCVAIFLVPPFSKLPASVILARSQSYYEEGHVAESEVNIELTGTQNGNKMQITSHTTQSESYLDQGAQGYEYRNVITTEGTDAYGAVDKRETTEGYANGYMYMSYQPIKGTEMGSAYRHKSPLKAEEYREFLEAREEESRMMVPEDEFGEVTYRFGGLGKTLTVICDDYLQPKNSAFDEMLQGMAASSPVAMKVKQLHLEMEFDSLRQAQTEERLQVELVATDGSEWTIKMDAHSVLSRPEEGSTWAPADFDTYEETTDLRQRYELLDQMNELMRSEGVQIYQKTSLSVKSNSGSASGQQNVSYHFGVRDGVFQYIATSVDKSGTVQTRIRYDGEKKITEEKGAEAKTEEQSQGAAKLFVEDCLSDFFYDPHRITQSAEIIDNRTGNRTLVLTHQVDRQTRQQLSAHGLNGADLSQVRVTTTIVWTKDGAISMISSGISYNKKAVFFNYSTQLTGFVETPIG